MDIMEKLTNVQASIFDYEIKNVSNNLVNIFSEIIDNKLIDQNNQGKMNLLNNLMNHCLVAMQKKDYLLLADILEYELKPLVGGTI